MFCASSSETSRSSFRSRITGLGATAPCGCQPEPPPETAESRCRPSCCTSAESAVFAGARPRQDDIGRFRPTAICGTSSAEAAGLRSLLLDNHDKAALENPTMSTISRWTAVLSFSGFITMACVIAAPVEGAGSPGPTVAGVPTHWINSEAADDPVEQFVVRKSPPSQARPSAPAADRGASDVRQSGDAVGESAVATADATVGETVAAKRSSVRASVTWRSVIPSSVLWAGAGMCGACLAGLIGWQWVRSRRSRDLPEVAVLSLVAFQQSNKSVPQSASSAVGRRAA